MGGSQARDLGYLCWRLLHVTPAAPRPAVAAFLRVAWAPLGSESPGMLVETQNPDFTVNHLNQSLCRGAWNLHFIVLFFLSFLWTYY